MSLFDVEGEFERRIVEYDEDLFTFDEIDQNLKDIDPLPQLANQQQSDDEETIAKKRLRPIIYSSDEDDGVVLSQSKKRAFSVRNNRLLGRNNANALRQNAANRNENNVPAANRANGQLTKRIAEKYHVIRKIGFGNYGTVSLARLKETNKLAAIKQSSFKVSFEMRFFVYSKLVFTGFSLSIRIPIKIEKFTIANRRICKKPTIANSWCTFWSIAAIHHWMVVTLTCAWFSNIAHTTSETSFKTRISSSRSPKSRRC